MMVLSFNIGSNYSIFDAPLPQVSPVNAVTLQQGLDARTRAVAKTQVRQPASLVPASVSSVRDFKAVRRCPLAERTLLKSGLWQQDLFLKQLLFELLQLGKALRVMRGAF
jgi:hypothetical protein